MGAPSRLTSAPLSTWDRKLSALAPEATCCAAPTELGDHLGLECADRLQVLGTERVTHHERPLHE